MTDKLPPNLLALFAPRPPLRWVPHPDFAPEQRRTTNITGLGEYLPALAAYKDKDGYVPTESWLQMRDRKKLEKQAKQEKLLTDAPIKYKPAEDPNIRGDPFKTLIVARLSYDANEHDLEKEFGRFGPIERIRIIADTHAHEKGNKKKKPHRGYAFVVFEPALDGCDGIRIKDRRIKVDVERGRTVKGWKPRRFGGGLGGRGYTKAAAARPAGPVGFGGGGFGGGRDGGFRGGFQGGRGRGGGFRGGDRGFRGGGGGGGFGGGRDRGFGASNGYGAPPNAPAGPGSGGRSGGYGGDRDRGGYDSRSSGRSYDDRSGGGRDGGRGGDRGGDRFGGGDRDRRSGANFEPVRDRGSREYRDYDRSREDDTRKRGYEGGYEDPRKLRRY
ncbi:putative u1 small nuclear ribonucleo protein [Eutypa lata UCREL1]|uniref:U1 small nuclear ribonucleoprotein 70 kDa n=1 Tax=Eutypa lata (strain UCR-EL1) TaxID=1287681 RepID=M7TDH5_EUTLA|nr:putative u1 small nuclear ribonucleo protein [Eutypa lata UCREL1]